MLKLSHGRGNPPTIGKEIIMNEKHYVLQMKRYEWENLWDNLPRKYATYEEAEAELKKKNFPKLYRIAESYTVIRYKAAKR